MLQFHPWQHQQRHLKFTANQWLKKKKLTHEFVGGRKKEAKYGTKMYLPWCEIGFPSVFVQNVSECFEKPKPGGGIENLTRKACWQTIVDAHPSLFFGHFGNAKGFPACTGHAGSNSDGIGWMNNTPSQTSAETGRAENHALWESWCSGGWRRWWWRRRKNRRGQHCEWINVVEKQ